MKIYPSDTIIYETSSDHEAAGSVTPIRDQKPRLFILEAPGGGVVYIAGRIIAQGLTLEEAQALLNGRAGTA